MCGAEHVFVKPLFSPGKRGLGLSPEQVHSEVISPSSSWSVRGDRAVCRLASQGRRSLVAVYSAREVAHD